MRYIATASVSFEYDTNEQPWIESADDARQDLIDLLASGDLGVSDYDIEIEEVAR